MQQLSSTVQVERWIFWKILALHRPHPSSTSHFPLLPGCSRHSGCCWAVANSQSEHRRVPLTAVMQMKSSPLPHQTFHHIFPVINGYDVTSQVERPSAHRRVPGYFCQGSTYAHTHAGWKSFCL